MHKYQDQKLIPGNITTLSTELTKPSPILLGNRISDKWIEELKKLEFDRLFFFTESKLHELYAKEIYAPTKEAFPNTELFELSTAGEHSKSFSNLEHMCSDLIEKGVSKKSILIAFGGGAVGNIVGLCAGLIYRGIRFIEVPTTFTGQTDSTLSNKQGINGKTGKNQIGLYHAPIFIWSDTQFLETEPRSSTRSGIIEGIKNGFIHNPEFLLELRARLNPELKFSDEETYSLAYNIIQSKLDILREDPTEKLYGLVLEYGHTFGHGIEWLEKGKMSHGESVSIGMKIAAELSHILGIISAEVVQLHYDIIENRLGFNNPLPSYITTDLLMNAMLYDNKKTGKELRFVLLEKLGKCINEEGDYLHTVDLDLVRKAIDKFTNNDAVQAKAG